MEWMPRREGYHAKYRTSPGVFVWLVSENTSCNFAPLPLMKEEGRHRSPKCRQPIQNGIGTTIDFMGRDDRSRSPSGCHSPRNDCWQAARSTPVPSEASRER